MDLVPMAVVVDLATGVVGTVYITLDDKMIAWGPIILMGATIAIGPGAETYGPFADAYLLINRVTVWEKLTEILLAQDSFTVVKAAKRSHNGRLAYTILYDHYLSPNNVDNMAGEAEKALVTLTYHGRKRNWTSEKYALGHLKQYLILDGLKPHGYIGIDPGSKVCHLNNGIKTTIIDAVKSQIILVSTSVQVLPSASPFTRTL
jgi:hypothetical protein